MSRTDPRPQADSPTRSDTVRPEPPGGRRGEHTAGVLDAVRGFYDRQTHPEGRTGARSASSGRLAQRSDADSERPDDAERAAIIESQVADVEDTGGEVWLFDLDRQRFRIVSQDEALRMCLAGRATLSEPRTTATAQGILD